MSSFLNSSFGGSSAATQQQPSPDMAARKQAIIDQVHGELALAAAQELMNKMNEKCFAKCITKPSTSLSGSEETCLSRCMDRYMEAFNIVGRSYQNRLSRERAQGPGAIV